MRAAGGPGPGARRSLVGLPPPLSSAAASPLPLAEAEEVGEL